MIIDTSVLVDVDRGHCSDKKIERLRELEDPKVSTVTAVEFRAGAFLSDSEVSVDVLESVSKVPLNDDVADAAARLWAMKYQQDLEISTNDLYISATAIAEGEKVLTSDVSDFRPVPMVEVVDWGNF